MFTGIIEEIGTVDHIAQDHIAVNAKTVLQDTAIGDSIAVNGVCLTVTSFTVKGFTADVMPETFRRSNLGRLAPGSRVNLERAMAANGRFGGHIVSGHIDGTGTITRMKRENNAVWVTVTAEAPILKLIVEKGSVAIDGISLTVASVEPEQFSVSVIPHTGSETTLLGKKPGDVVNLENDIIGKYVQRLLEPSTPPPTKSTLTEEFLAKHGFL